MMKRFMIFLLGILILSIGAKAQPVNTQPDKIDISLKNNTKNELQTKEQLERLLTTYDVSKWIFTNKVRIDEKTIIPHSHPVLTLSTRHLKDDELLLATFVHEQLHWFLEQKSEATEKSVKELQILFPKVPFANSEGARDERSTYIHLLVNYFEYRAMKLLLGELKARQVMEFWTTDHYTWIYRTVLERGYEIGRIAFKNKLIPLVLEKPAN